MLTDNELIINSYKSTLSNLRARYKVMDPEHPDKKTISGMISSLEYSLFWLKNGHEKPPNRDISQRSYEQRTEYWADVSLVPQYHKDAVVLIGGGNDDDLKPSQIETIDNALKLLTDKEQQTFIDIYANSHTYQQVADLYGCSKGTVQSYINRAKKKISTAIKEGAISQ